MSTSQIQIEEKTNHTSITLNNPKKHNAFNEKMIAEISHTLSTLEKKPPGILILQAAGKSFCAGADLAWMQKMVGYNKEENIADANALALMLEKLYRFPAVTIANVQGAAFGGGVGLAACCDIAIASEAATFCFSEVALGLSPSTISPYVIKKIGLQKTQYYFLTAERFSAKDAEDIGLIQKAVPPEALNDSLTALISNIAKNGPHALVQTKKLIQNIDPVFANDTIQNYTSEHIANCRISTEAQQRLTQFLKMKSS